MHSFTSTTEWRGSFNSNHRRLITLTIWSEGLETSPKTEHIAYYFAFPGIAYMTGDRMVSIFFFNTNDRFYVLIKLLKIFLGVKQQN